VNDLSHEHLTQNDLSELEAPFYLYAVGRANDAIPTWLGDAPVDGAGQPFTLTHNGLTVVMSAGSKERYPISRKNLLAHKTIVENFMKLTPTLPVRFNTVAPSLDILRRRLLTQKAAELQEKITSVDGRIEISVRATWIDDAKLLERVLEEATQIRELRDSLALTGAGHQQRIRLGQLVENAILERRDSLGAKLEAYLKPLVEGLAQGTLPDRVVANLSLLLPESKFDEVEAAIYAFDAENDLTIVRITGPLAPFTFSEMTVTWEDSDEELASA
jgi:Gas vesicle synthesis protein GvpL/GvpF